ncbi:MAG TPA: hypothetical protein VNX66_04055 [Candidatus Sulfotelmatobacter sp.]|jgi:hypothetical protein|nr:hypothetical protein [Candidatus Sulfotelmatobacter sp.]
MIAVEKEKDRTRRFDTPLGTLFVWGVVNSETRGTAGWHFMLKGANGPKNFFSEHGNVFSRVSFHSDGLQAKIVLEEAETDTEMVRFLREYWEEYIERLDFYAV